ncbi:hypothetical protein GBA52_000300, partial [Prunus armeniaca]
PRRNPSHPTIHEAISVKCSATTTHIQDRPPAQPQFEDRVFNFADGPTNLLENVLLKAQSELYNWHRSGMSIMEMSHRGKEFLSIIQKADTDLRTLLNISSENLKFNMFNFF